MVTVKNWKVQPNNKWTLQQKDAYIVLHLWAYIFLRVLAKAFGSLRKQPWETEIQAKQKLWRKLVGEAMRIDTENEKTIKIKIALKRYSKASCSNVPHLWPIVRYNIIANPLENLYIEVQNRASPKRQKTAKITSISSRINQNRRVQY